MVLCVMRRWNDEWETTTKTQRPTNESERMLMWTYPFVTVILVDGWTEKGRATMSLLSYSFSRCAHTTMFFFLLVSCVFISIFTLNVGVEKKKSSITLIRILDRIALHNWRAICHKFNNDDWQKKTQTNIQNINQQPKTSSHQHYCGTLSECACIGLLALMASLSKFIQCESERKCAICANKWPVVDRPMWNK